MDARGSEILRNWADAINCPDLFYFLILDLREPCSTSTDVRTEGGPSRVPP